MRSSHPISEIGQALGYESQSAFSLAFKRVMGCSPGQYGRGRSLGHPRAIDGGSTRARTEESMGAWGMGSDENDDTLGFLSSEK